MSWTFPIKRLVRRPSLFHIFLVFGNVSRLAFAVPDVDVRVEKVQDPVTHTVTLWFSNAEIMPATVILSGEANGFLPIPLPKIFIVPAGERFLGARFTPDAKARSLRLSLSSQILPGDFSTVPDTNHVWQFPWTHGVRHLVGQGYFGTFSHHGLHALDFTLAQGEGIHAAREGRVVKVRSNETRGGLDPSLKDKANGVDVLHRDGTIASYAHMEFHGTAVTQGQWVVPGDLLGRCGFTGYAEGVHLHFQVHHATPEGKKTLPTRFRGPSGEAVAPVAGKWFMAIHGDKSVSGLKSVLDLRGSDFFNHRASIPATGNLDFRQELREDRLVVFLQNGKDKPLKIQATPTFKNLVPIAMSPGPFEIDARTEIFFGLFAVVDGTTSTRVGFSFLVDDSPR